MVQIARFYGITISMYYKDHNPPHFHAEYGWNEVQIHIEDMRILRWKISPKATSLVIERALAHQDELLDNRHIMETQWLLKKIDPLQ